MPDDPIDYRVIIAPEDGGVLQTCDVCERTPGEAKTAGLKKCPGKVVKLLAGDHKTQQYREVPVELPSYDKFVYPKIGAPWPGEEDIKEVVMSDLNVHACEHVNDLRKTLKEGFVVNNDCGKEGAEYLNVFCKKCQRLHQLRLPIGEDRIKWAR